MTFQEFQALCEARRSVRYFDQKPVTREQMDQLLKIAQLAPSVENVQPWRFHVIFDHKLRTVLMDASCYGNFVEGASVFLIVTCNTDARPQTQEILWNPRELEYSCMAAMEHILLGATAMGLGACWVSLHHGAPHEILKLPMHEIVVGGIMLGNLRPGEESESHHHVRRPLEEVVTYYE